MIRLLVCLLLSGLIFSAIAEPAPDGAAPAEPAAIRRPLLGVHMQAPTIGSFRQANPLLPFWGVQIVGTVPGSAAEKMGLQAGDIVYEVNGKPVRTKDDLIRQVANRMVGADIWLRFYRPGTHHTVQGTLTEWTDDVKVTVDRPLAEYAERLRMYAAAEKQREQLAQRYRVTEIELGKEQPSARDLNGALWAMHEASYYPKGWEALLEALQQQVAPSDIGYHDTIAWVIADHGDVAKAIDYYRAHVLGGLDTMPPAKAVPYKAAFEKLTSMLPEETAAKPVEEGK